MLCGSVGSSHLVNEEVHPDNVGQSCCVVGGDIYPLGQPGMDVGNPATSQHFSVVVVMGIACDGTFKKHTFHVVFSFKISYVVRQRVSIVG